MKIWSYERASDLVERRISKHGQSHKIDKPIERPKSPNHKLHQKEDRTLNPLSAVRSRGVLRRRKNIFGFLLGYTKPLYTIETASFDWENLLIFLLQFEGMSKVRDRTEDFKDVARRSALSLGYDESKTARYWHPLSCINLGKEQFLMKHKKDYVDLHRTTEQERDSTEHEVTIFVKSCKEQIDVLRNNINEDDANSKGWLGLKGDNLNADTIAHKHGVVLVKSFTLLHHSLTGCGQYAFKMPLTE
ncbi:Qa-SNARE, syp8/Ufe1p/Syntaxin 18-type [Datura stramonium]|uniref:Qa-SNARE, syp8/Ufe1p/Syntaxin 18-type n=1 Tax=Datura stramonium TaxID=4076 RepID=A0ABS8TER8_DATST|nr:Qa-SNARE, syp8/Ufe1p/Syntaxin 18-type [Datura stramonium]